MDLTEGDGFEIVPGDGILGISCAMALCWGRGAMEQRLERMADAAGALWAGATSRD